MPEPDIEIPSRGIFIRKLWALTRPYFWSEEKWRARGLLLVVVAMTLGLVFLDVIFNYWNNDFYNALQNKNEAAFWRLIIKFCYIAGPYIVVAVYNNYLQQMLQIRWRRWMTDRLLGHWLEKRNYYRLQFSPEGADNPEQRIEQDISLFTSNTIDLSLGMLNSVVTLASFVTILWTLSGALSFNLGAHHISVPGYMVWVAVAYAAIGSGLAYWIGRPLIRTNFELQRSNATFRFGMSRLRENAESVAFYRGEESEHRSLMLLFGSVWHYWWRLMRQTKRLNWFVNFYAQLANIFPLLVAAPRYFSGALPLGGLMQTASAFGQVQGALSWFINAFDTLASWKATVDRLTGFVDALDRAQAIRSGIDIASAGASSLQAENLGLALPDGRELIQGFNAKIEPGEKILISGPSGAGKTTLFRALAGLWPFGSGKIETPETAKVLFLPQRPYLPIGPMRQALAYPAQPQDFDDAAIRSVLYDVNLENLGARLDETSNWSMALSIGEQQRLAIARALLLKPDWLYLDEATSALDGANEQRMYQLLAERLPNATVLSIAHRAEVARYHRQKLEIDPNAQTATLTPISTG